MWAATLCGWPTQRVYAGRRISWNVKASLEQLPRAQTRTSVCAFSTPRCVVVVVAVVWEGRGAAATDGTRCAVGRYPEPQTLSEGVDDEVMQLVSGGSMVVMNKVDLLDQPLAAGAFAGKLAPLAAAGRWDLSCKTGDGVDTFLRGLSQRVKDWYAAVLALLTAAWRPQRAHAACVPGCSVEQAAPPGEDVVVTRARHREQLAEALESLNNFIAAPAQVRPVHTPPHDSLLHVHRGSSTLRLLVRARLAACPHTFDAQADLAAEELRLAVQSLGRVTGRVDVEELLDVVFRDFCIGK